MEPISHRARRLADLLEERILVLDGASGTMLQAGAAGAPVDLLNLTDPDRVAALDRTYLGAGADILSTNSFNGAEGPDLIAAARAGARLARAAADQAMRDEPQRPRFVAGVLGPTNRSISLRDGGRSVGFDDLAARYRMAGQALIEGGADIILLETVFDPLNAAAAIAALGELGRADGATVPMMISATIDTAGRLLTGQTIEAFWSAIAHAQPLAVGLNCGFGVEVLRPHLQALAAIAPVPIIVYPNAGLPDASGHYHDGPEKMATCLGDFAAEGLLNIVGGCCGTTPAHIAAIADAVRGLAPRVIRRS